MEPPSKRPRIPPPSYRFGLLPPDLFEKVADEIYYVQGGKALGSFLAKLEEDTDSKARGIYYCAKLANRLKMRARTVDLAEPVAILQSVADSVRARLEDPKPDYCSICGAWHPEGKGLQPTPSPLQEASGIAPDIFACADCWRVRYSMALITEHSAACLKDGGPQAGIKIHADFTAVKHACDLCLMRAFPDGYASRLCFPGTFDSMRRTCTAVQAVVRKDFFVDPMGVGLVPLRWKSIALMWADRQQGKTDRDIQESFIRHFVFLAEQHDDAFNRFRALKTAKIWRARLAQ